MKHLSTLAVFSLIAAALISASTIQAKAGDDGLYEKPVDPNMAFVRVVIPGNATASINGRAASAMDDGVSAYFAVEPGTIKIATEQGETSIEVSAGKFYSVVPSGAAPLGVEDLVNTNPAKAILSLYNLSDAKDVDVYVPQAKAEALTDVSNGLSKSVAVKAPLKLDLVVRADGKDVVTLEQIEFKRLSAMSIVVSGGGAAIKAVVLPNKIAK